MRRNITSIPIESAFLPLGAATDQIEEWGLPLEHFAHFLAGNGKRIVSKQP